MLNISDDLKKLFMADSIPKQIIIHFPNGEFEDITNDRLILESFTFDESIIRQDTLKFGLCEASSISFECADVGNCVGCTIEASIAIEGYEPVPFGVFVVDSCKRLADLSRRKIEAYSMGGENIEIPSLYANSKMSVDYDALMKVIANQKFFEDTTDLQEYFSRFTPTTRFPLGPIGYLQLEVEVMFYLGPSVYKPYVGMIDCEYVDDFYNAIDTFENNALSKSGFTSDGLKLFKTACDYVRNHNVIVEADALLRGTNTGSYKVENGLNNLMLEYDNDREWVSGNLIRAIKIVEGEEDMRFDVFKDVKYYLGELPNALGVTVKPSEIKDSGALPYFESYAEINATFGRSNRYGKYEFIRFKDFVLNQMKPHDGLYPSNDLYPGLVVFDDRVNKHLIKEFWYEEYVSKKIGKVVVEYRDAEGENQTLEIPIGDGENTYTFSGNKLFDGIITNPEQITELITTMFAPYVTDIQAVPVDLTIKGLPYVEAGDQILIQTDEGYITTYIFNRSLKGIHALKDTITTNIVEYNS